MRQPETLRSAFGKPLRLNRRQQVGAHFAAQVGAYLLHPVQIGAAAFTVIGVHGVVVGMQVGFGGGAVGVFGNDGVQGQARAHGRVLVRIAQTHPRYRHHALRQAEEAADFGGVVADAADEHAAQPHAFGGEQHVLREYADIHCADQQHFQPVGLCVGGELFVAGGIGAEYEKFGTVFYIAVSRFAAGRADGADLRAQGGVGYADDADVLHKAGCGGGLSCADERIQHVGADGGGGESADGAVGEGGFQDGFAVLHGVSLCGRCV